MNNTRRKAIAQISLQLAGIKDKVEYIMNEEQDAFDSMPENLQGSMRGDNSLDAIDNLDDVINSIEEAIDGLDSIC